MPGKIADPKLAEKGRQTYEWASARMAIISRIVDKNKRAQPLAGLRLGFCLHVTKETSVLVMGAKALGARIAICSANPLSAQDDIAAFLYGQGVSIYAWRGETKQQYQGCIGKVIESGPAIVTDDGADLHVAAHKRRAKGIIGGTEETTSGVKRLAALERAGELAYPVIAVNNAPTKYLFDNRHGTGQSAMDGIVRATSVLLAGKQIVVCGYGWVGKGVASRARGMGANVTVTEVDPVRALEAKMDGFKVLKLSDAALYGDIFITCTGQTAVIRQEHFKKMKDGAFLTNAGHFDVEIDARSLHDAYGKPVGVSPNVERFQRNGKKLYLLCKGRVVNLVAAEGNPPEVMGLSFANQLLAILYVAKNHHKMETKVHDVPKTINSQVARYALEYMNIKIDALTEEQKRYTQSSR